MDTETSATNDWSFYSKEEYGLWLAYAKAAIVFNIGTNVKFFLENTDSASFKLKMSVAIWPAFSLSSTACVTDGMESH